MINLLFWVEDAGRFGRPVGGFFNRDAFLSPGILFSTFFYYDGKNYKGCGWVVCQPLAHYVDFWIFDMIITPFSIRTGNALAMLSTYR
jgi:hypothetical protein